MQLCISSDWSTSPLCAHSVPLAINTHIHTETVKHTGRHGGFMPSYKKRNRSEKDRTWGKVKQHDTACSTKHKDHDDKRNSGKTRYLFTIKLVQPFLLHMRDCKQRHWLILQRWGCKHLTSDARYERFQPIPLTPADQRSGSPDLFFVYVKLVS